MGEIIIPQHPQVRVTLADEIQLSPVQLERFRASLARGITNAEIQGTYTSGVHITINRTTDANPQARPEGFVPFNTSRIIIDIDPSRISDNRYLSELSTCITHELNHVEREANRGIPVRTLADALVSEGLAQMSEIQAGHPIDRSRIAASHQSMHQYMDHALRNLNTDLRADRPDSTYPFWFTGRRTPNDTGQPNFGGYPLGLAIVSSYMRDHNITNMRDLVGVNTSAFIEHWQQSLNRQGHDQWLQRNVPLADTPTGQPVPPIRHNHSQPAP